MPKTVWAVVRERKIELPTNMDIPEGARVLVTVLADKEEPRFWQKTSQSALDTVWNNHEDDVYARLLEK